MTLSTPETRKCRARRSNGSQCSAWAIHGGSVCSVHGGRAPQVKRAAAERLHAAMDEMLDPALLQLRRLIDGEINDPRPDDVRLKAIKDLLDRMGFKPVERRELSGPDGAAIPIKADFDFDSYATLFAGFTAAQPLLPAADGSQ